MSRKNIVLAVLHVASKKPNWNLVCGALEQQLKTTYWIKSSLEEKFHEVNFRVIMMIADLKAKASMLNMFTFRAYCGCHYYAGVKGLSAFSNIVSNFPQSAGIDYMHAVLLGVFPRLMDLFCNNMAKSKVLDSFSDSIVENGPKWILFVLFGFYGFVT